jgi:hypothetical protein
MLGSNKNQLKMMVPWHSTLSQDHPGCHNDAPLKQGPQPKQTTTPNLKQDNHPDHFSLTPTSPTLIVANQSEN